MKYLRDLAMRTGRSFAVPKTQREARQQIEALQKFTPTSRGDRRRETREIREDMARRRGGASAVRDDEIAGYGSEARWLHHPQD